MYECTVCGKTSSEQKHWVECSKEGGPVCMKHCFDECEYMVMHHCKFRDEEQRKNALPTPSKVMAKRSVISTRKRRY